MADPLLDPFDKDAAGFIADLRKQVDETTERLLAAADSATSELRKQNLEVMRFLKEERASGQPTPG